MRKLLLILLLASCTQYPTAEDVLTNQGYTQITILSHDFNACKEDGKTHHSQHFRAVKDGKKVTGNVCFSYEGTYSIEIKKPL